jgi:GNAT superfamily N-acetyltransferase
MYSNPEKITLSRRTGEREEFLIRRCTYGTYIGYPEERQKVCVSFEISMVDKAYRGYGLQRYFIEMREELARHMGAEEVLVTISPKNERSLANMQYEGFEIVCTKPLYQGAMRHILRKIL